LNGPIIPPSILMLVYAFFSGASVRALILAGIIPALIMGAVLIFLVAWQSRRHGFQFEPRMASAVVLTTTIKAIGPLLMPIILLGGIYSSVFTPTEAVAAAGTYAILLSVFLYRKTSWCGLYTTLVEIARQLSLVFMLIGGGFAFNYVFTAEKVTEAIAAFILELDISQLQLLFVVHAAFILMGMFLTKAPIMNMVIPALLPRLQPAGVDMVHFGGYHRFEHDGVYNHAADEFDGLNRGWSVENSYWSHLQENHIIHHHALWCHVPDHNFPSSGDVAAKPCQILNLKHGRFDAFTLKINAK
jgi:tripartite ATP-independent transporter DctM subunit